MPPLCTGGARDSILEVGPPRACLRLVSPGPEAPSSTHIHDCINLSNGLVVSGKLVDLDSVADQLTHDLDLELVELALRDGVGLGNDGNYVHL